MPTPAEYAGYRSGPKTAEPFSPHAAPPSRPIRLGGWHPRVRSLTRTNQSCEVGWLSADRPEAVWPERLPV